MVAVAGLLAVLVLQLGLTASRLSQTWDEGCHIFAGYHYWKSGDYGINPEHPPLLKLLATAPLLKLPLKVPQVQNRRFKAEEYLDGRAFLFGNNADQILFRTRMSAGLLTLLLGWLIFAAAREMFGNIAGLVALALFVFDPNFLAHGSLVTTDVAVSCFLFAAVYAYYRYKKHPTVLRLVLVGVGTGLAFASKHSGIMAVPILLLLGLAEIVRTAVAEKKLLKPLLTTAGEALLVAVVSLAVLWSFYGFRYAARPGGAPFNPPLAASIQSLKNPLDVRLIGMAERHHWLPEAYLYGLAEVRKLPEENSAYLFGRTYAHGVWQFFPAVFFIKSTLPMILLLMLLPAALLAGMRGWRELAFLVAPPVLYFAQAVNSGIDTGVRHLLPIYPFLIILAAGAAWTLIQRNRQWNYVVLALVVFQAVSSARAFPNYLAYSNEAWGGPKDTYLYLTDSNTDWGQQLKEVRQYLDQHNIKHCWFAYYVENVVDRNYYGVPCEGLPTISSPYGNEPDVPAAIDGVVLISASSLSGFNFLPYEENPYESFKRIKPVAQIGYGVFVYEGHFDVPLVSALSHARQALALLDQNRIDEAMAEARMGMQLAPYAVEVQRAMANVNQRAKREAESRRR